jgi:hypothetical protein
MVLNGVERGGVKGRKCLGVEVDGKLLIFVLI